MPRRFGRSTPRSAKRRPSRSRRSARASTRCASGSPRRSNRSPGSSASDDGEILGYAYASPHRERAAYRWSVDVSAYVRDGHRRSGRRPGTLYVACSRSCASRAFTRRSPASPCPTPAASAFTNRWDLNRSVSIDIGFKCGDWHDVAWYQLALRDYTDEPEDRSPSTELLVLAAEQPPSQAV